MMTDSQRIGYLLQFNSILQFMEAIKLFLTDGVKPDGTLRMWLLLEARRVKHRRFH